MSIEPLRHVDSGGNPDTFTSDVFRAALRANQGAKGKVQAVRCSLESAVLSTVECQHINECIASLPLPFQT